MRLNIVIKQLKGMSFLNTNIYYIVIKLTRNLFAKLTLFGTL